jgi:elongation factor P--(R)-beta-lysine ligase
MSPPSPFWRPDIHADRRSRLLARSAIKRAIRSWFEGQGFVEVETSCLVASPGNETHLHAFATERIGPDLARERQYLHTSPEFACKKLLAAGEKRIFTFAPCFRNRERGALHASEFTMLEWYRAGEPYAAVQDDCAAIICLAAKMAGNPVWRFRGQVADTLEPPDRLTVAQAFVQHLGLPAAQAEALFARPKRASLLAVAEAFGHRVAADETWSGIFSRLIAEIEPKLGLHRPLLLTEYPASEAALARPVPDRPWFAERFEAYVCGIELANGFGELTDAARLRANLDAQMVERERIYGERYPLDEDFLAAVAAMPPASGCALGFDRLVMLAVGANRVDDVIWTPLS